MRLPPTIAEPLPRMQNPTVVEFWSPGMNGHAVRPFGAVRQMPTFEAAAGMSLAVPAPDLGAPVIVNVIDTESRLTTLPLIRVPTE